jgi:hypothetical protein
VGGDRAPAKAPETDLDRLIARFLSGRPQATARAYTADLEDLARFLGTSIEDAVRSLLLGPEIARQLVSDYAVELRRRGLAPATARRRLATLRALLAMAQQLGVVAWELELPTERETELAASGWSGSAPPTCSHAIRGRRTGSTSSTTPCARRWAATTWLWWDPCGRCWTWARGRGSGDSRSAGSTLRC